MEQQQQQQQQQMQVQPHLKCPRCDSSNTKFCYYNNYSLSQPRHLCKACKRYWTRGGTLRSVPVGGKCRKNKRVKQTTTTSSSIAQDPIFAAAKPSTTVKSSQVDLSSSTTKTHIVNPLYSKRDGKDLSFPQFSKTGTDLLGFLKSQNLSQNLNPGDDTNVAVSNQVFSGYPFYGVSSTSTTSTMASSIIPSSLEQQNQLVFNGFKESAEHPPYGFLGPDDVHQWLTRNGGGNQLVKDAKMEGNGNRFDWKTNGNHIYIEAMNFTSDPPFMWSSSAPWLDSTDIGSSVPFLI